MRGLVCKETVVLTFGVKQAEKGQICNADMSHISPSYHGEVEGLTLETSP